MSDDTDFIRRPHRPLLTVDAVMLGILVGADCPHKLAALFDVSILNPDLVGIAKELLIAGAIASGGPAHRAPDGLRCEPIVVTPPAAEG